MDDSRLPAGLYLASSPGAPEPDVADVLVQAQHRDAERRLLDLLDRVHDRVADVRARDEREHAREVDEGRGLDPGLVAALEAVTGAPGAPWSTPPCTDGWPRAA